MRDTWCGSSYIPPLLPFLSLLSLLPSFPPSSHLTPSPPPSPRLNLVSSSLFPCLDSWILKEVSCYRCVKPGNLNNGRAQHRPLFEQQIETDLWSIVDCFTLPIMSGAHSTMFCSLVSHFLSSYQIVVIAVHVDSWLPSDFKQNWLLSIYKWSCKYSKFKRMGDEEI